MITQTDEGWEVKTAVYRLQINAATGMAELANGKGQRLVEFPLSFRVEVGETAIHLAGPLKGEACGKELHLQARQPAASMARQTVNLVLEEKFFTISFGCELKPGAECRPNRIEYFRDPELGMRLNPMKRGFCVPAAPMSEEDYLNIFPSVSVRGLATPPVLNIGLEFAHGHVGLGLLDLSDATGFGVAHPLMGVLVDAKGGNLQWSGGVQYQGPRVLWHFPKDGWDGVRGFREHLAAEGLVRELLVERPSWWKRPAYCTYGDQIMAMQPALYTCKYFGAAAFNETWVREAVRRTETRLGYAEFSVVIDAFWQRGWDTDPEPDPERFPHLRELIDGLHERGHKVLLWYAPHGLEAGRPEFGKLARRFGVVGKYAEPAQLLVGLPSLTYLDYSGPQAEEYLREVARRLLSDEKGCLNCDGMKLDFLALVPPTEAGADYLAPENGMGLRMVKRYLELFQPAAKAVKPDAMLNYSASDPRLAHLFDIHRLHDIKVTCQERERRARVAALANPDLLIDSDGAVMFSDWVEPTYIAAAIYGTPSLYYSDVFNDGVKLSDEMMKALGKLFAMVARRKWGWPEFLAYGCWRLHDYDADRIVGESYAGRFCWLQTEGGDIEAMGFREQRREICLHGRTLQSIKPEPEDLQVRGDCLKATWKGGMIYRLQTAG